LSRKIPIIRDNKDVHIMVQDKIQQVVARIYGYKRGSVFTPKDFIDLASHETIRKALSRLTYEKKIRRLMRGVYEYPVYSSILNAPASPDPDAIARAIARAHGWTILPSGETALNLLGLSTQVPAKWEYFSDGPTKTYRWRSDGGGGDDNGGGGGSRDANSIKTTFSTGGGGTLAFRQRANKEITKLSSKTALLVQALKALGKRNISRSTISQLCKRLSETERKRAAREARYATSWVYEIIKGLAKEGETNHA